MTYKQFTEKLLKKHGIQYECIDELGDGCFKGERNGEKWLICDTCSWSNCYQLTIGDYRANRISIKTAVKKILAL